MSIYVYLLTGGPGRLEVHGPLAGKRSTPLPFIHQKKKDVSNPLFFTHSEIDIFEGINLSPSSQMGLHTTPGCTQSPQAKQTSKIVNGTDCQGGAGCIVTNDNPVSFGASFAQANGGVFVTELAETGVS